MTKSQLLGALLLLVSILSSSCDSKPKPAPTEPAEQTPAEPAPAEQASTGQEQTEEAPAEPAPADQASSEVAPSDQAPIEQTPTEVEPAEEAPTEQPPAEPAPTEESPTAQAPRDDSVKDAKLQYLKVLQASMNAAMEQKDLDKAGQLAQEIQKLAAQIQEENNSSKTPESSDKAEESPQTTPVIAQESKPVIKESAPEPVPQTQRPVEIPKPTPPPKLKLLLDVVPKATSKREDYYANEEISLKIKVTNQNLKEEAGDLTLHYFIIGKGTASNNEYTLFNSGEKKFQLGKTHKDRLFELTTDICYNKYWAYGTYGGSGYHKYDAWFVALLDKEGNVVQIKSNRSQFKDFNAFKALDKNSIFDKSLKKIQGRMIYRYN